MTGRAAYFLKGPPSIPRIVIAPQVIVVPPPVLVGGLIEEDAPNNVVPAVVRRNDVIVISPRKNAGPVAAAEPRPIPNLERIVLPIPDRPAFGFDAFDRSGELNKLPKPEADPVAEAVRQAR